MKIVDITIDIDDDGFFVGKHDITLKVETARKLYEVLKDFFAEPQTAKLEEIAASPIKPLEYFKYYPPYVSPDTFIQPVITWEISCDCNT